MATQIIEHVSALPLNYKLWLLPVGHWSLVAVFVAQPPICDIVLAHVG